MSCFLSLSKHLGDSFILKCLEHKVGFRDFFFVVPCAVFCLFLSLAFPRGIKGQKLKTEEHI